MIQIKGRDVTFTGEDCKRVKQCAKELGMSVKDFVVGCLWEKIMQEAKKKLLLRKLK